ncbi:MAG: hypothetical protein CMN30_12525 [Sandaracinus sp.]|nr:hypothetical protein [Sandaracinus sp.]
MALREELAGRNPSVRRALRGRTSGASMASMEPLDTREADEERWARQKRLVWVSLFASIGIVGCIVGALLVMAAAG